MISQVRCFRARSAGIDIVSNNVEISKSLADNTIPTTSTTAELPGGVGIRARGDNISIKDTIVRRSGVAGIWASGTDTDGSGNQFQTNKAERNSSSEWVIGSGDTDLGVNSANGRTISFTSAGGTFE